MTQGSAARAAMTAGLMAVAACTAMGSNPPAESSATTSVSTGASDAQRVGAWRPLFDGTSTDAWRGYKTQTMPAGWHIQDGVLTKTGAVEDIVTKDQFGNFELAWDWKLSPVVTPEFSIAAPRSTITSTGVRPSTSCLTTPDILTARAD